MTTNVGKSGDSGYKDSNVESHTLSTSTKGSDSPPKKRTTGPRHLTVMSVARQMEMDNEAQKVHQLGQQEQGQQEKTSPAALTGRQTQRLESTGQSPAVFHVQQTPAKPEANQAPEIPAQTRDHLITRIFKIESELQTLKKEQQPTEEINERIKGIENLLPKLKINLRKLIIEEETRGYTKEALLQQLESKRNQLKASKIKKETKLGETGSLSITDKRDLIAQIQKDIKTCEKEIFQLENKIINTFLNEIQLEEVELNVLRAEKEKKLTELSKEDLSLDYKKENIAEISARIKKCEDKMAQINIDMQKFIQWRS